MPTRRHKPFSRTHAIGQVVGRFAVGATGAVGTITDPEGKISAITRESAGKYKVVLKNRVHKVLDCVATVRKTSRADLKAQNVTLGGSNEDTVEFEFLAVATATDPADGDDVSFTIVVQTTKHVPL